MTPQAQATDGEVVHGIIKAETLQQFVDTLSELVLEAKLHFSDAGIRVQCVDPANVAMYCPIQLETGAFESLDAPGQSVVGVNLTSLDDKLGPANSDDLVNLSVDMETRMLHLEYRAIEQDMALIDPESVRSEPDVSDIDLRNQMVITGERFKQAVEIADINGDHVEIEGRPDLERAQWFVEGDTDTATIKFAKDETLDETTVNDETVTIMSLEYLKEIAKPMPKDTEVTVEFDDEFPIRMHYEACDGNLVADIMQAPRIST